MNRLEALIALLAVPDDTPDLHRRGFRVLVSKADLDRAAFWARVQAQQPPVKVLPFEQRRRA